MGLDGELSESDVASHDLYPKKWTQIFKKHCFLLLKLIGNKDNMRTIYTDKQVRKLKKNPCVFDCDKHFIHYTFEFKKRAVELQKQGISPNIIWKRAGFDISIWKKNYCNDTVKDWRRLVRKGGLERLNARGGIQSDTGTKEERTKLNRLELQVKYLEAENDFLAKLRAKRAESNSGLLKNIKSLEN